MLDMKYPLPSTSDVLAFYFFNLNFSLPFLSAIFMSLWMCDIFICINRIFLNRFCRLLHDNILAFCSGSERPL